MVNQRNTLPDFGPVFMTGATGCIGSYILTELLQHSRAHIMVLVRPPKSLPAILQNHRQIEILYGDLNQIHRFKSELAKTRILIHTAVAWGGSASFTVNLRQTHQLLAALNPEVCEQIIYFSTASLLGKQADWTQRSLYAGTDYIRSKSACMQWLKHQWLKNSIWSNRFYTLFPTVVLGGDENHPWSAASKGLKQLPQWLPWLNLISAQGRFHWIHARDIARMVYHWITKGWPAQEVILGNPAQHVTEVLEHLRQYAGLPKLPRLPLDPCLPILLPLLSMWMSNWDRYSFYHRHLQYPCIDPRKCGLEPGYENLADVLKELQISFKTSI